MGQKAVETKINGGKEVAFTKAFSSFSVNDLHKAKKFYGEMLCLEIRNEEEGIGLEFEDGQIVFLYPKDDHQPATFTVLNLTVDNIVTAVDELIGRGIKFESYGGEMETDDKGIFWGKKSGHGPNIAWFKDPAGNILSVIEDQ